MSSPPHWHGRVLCQVVGLIAPIRPSSALAWCTAKPNTFVMGVFRAGACQPSMLDSLEKLFSFYVFLDLT